MKAAFACLLLLSTPQGPLLISDLWPGEGVPHFAANTKTLDLHEQPSRTSPLHRVPTSPGAAIDFDSTRFMTLRAGHVLARESGELSGRVFGRVTHVSKAMYYAATIPSRATGYAKGDTLEYLQDRAEGTCMMRVRGEVIEADECPTIDSAAFATLTQPQTEWWIHVVMSRASQGWLLIDPRFVRELDRTF